VRDHGDFAFHGALGLDWRPNQNTALFVDLRHGQNETMQNVMLTSAPFYESHVMNSLTLNFQRLRLLPSVNLMAVADAQRVDFADNAIGVDGVTVERIGSDLTTVHALVQADASQFNNRNTLSLAGEASHSDANQGAVSASNMKAALVAQNETVLLQEPRLVLNMGTRFEHVDVAMKDRASVSYVHFSPRISLSLAPSEKHAFRIASTTAYRTPDMWSVYMDSIYPSTYAPPVPPLYLQRASPWLKPEEVLSFEIGYRGHPWRWLRIDATSFVQQLREHTDVLRAALPISFENAGNDWQTGVELGVKVRSGKKLGAYGSYAYVHSTRHPPNAFYGYPAHILTVGGDATWREFSFNVDFHWFSSFDSTTLNISDTTLMFNTRRSLSEPMLNLRVGHRVSDRGIEIFLSARNILAMARDYNSLAVVPSTWANPIGAIFLLGLRMPTL